MNHSHRAPSFFWPVILIGAGAILLLRNLEIIPAFNLGALLRLWPLILVVIGLDILFGRRTSWIGGLIGLVAIGSVIAFLMLSPALGTTTTAGTTTDVISAPVENATSVNYYLETTSDPVEVKALTDSMDLINGTITHRGTLNFDVTGTTEKMVHLSETLSSDTWLQWGFVFSDQKWDIGLNPNIPSKVELDGGSGSVNMDLSGIKLTSLRAAMGSGSSNFHLPASSTSYEADIESGSGSVNITLPAGTDIVLSLDSGSGSVNVSVPQGSGLRVEVVDSGSGSLSIPPGMTKLIGAVSSETGTWQTSGFDQAAYKIVIRIANQGSGSISIQ